MKDVNGQYNFEGFTQLEDYVAAELVKYPHTVGLSFYHEAGVFTIEDKIKWDIYGMISDASKSLNGCRARFDFLQFSVEELYAEYNSYVRMAGDDAEYEAELLASNIKAMIAEEANLWNEQLQALEDEYLYQLEEAA